MKGAIDRVLTPALLFVAAVGVRALPHPTVFTAKHGIQAFGNDTYYHLRRIEYAIRNPGEFLGFDPYLNFPHGGRAIWSPTFDWLLAQLVLLGGPVDDRAAMESLLMWAPPVIGGLAVVGVYFIALHAFTRGIALAAAALLLLSPAHFWYSQIGFLDHHVAVAAMVAALLGAGMALLRVEPDGESPSPQSLRRASWLGIAIGASLLVWPGCLLHVATLQAFLGVRILLCRERAPAVCWARLLAFVHTVAFFVVVPFYAGDQWELWGDFSPVVGSNFQPLWLLVCTLGFAALSEFWRGPLGSGDRFDRIVSALALASLGLGVAIWLLPELSRGVFQGWGWFSKSEVFQASVAESAPLLRAPAERVQQLFSYFVYVAPLLAIWLAWDRRRSARADFWFLLVFGVVLGGATLMQRRFMNSAAIPYSLLLALALDLLRRRLAPLRVAAIPVFAAIVGVALWPSIASYGVDVANLQAAARGEAPYRVYSKRLLLLSSSATHWIRRLTPPTRGYLDPDLEPEYAVLAPWDLGHSVKYYGRRPVNVDNFGDDVARENFGIVDQYFQTDRESDAIAIARQLGARYVLVSAVEVRRTGGYGLRSMFARLSLPDPGPRRMVGKGAAARELQILRLVNHRLIFETRPFKGRPGEERSYYKLYELVEGARVEGAAPPGTVVEARLVLSPRFGGELLFVTAGKADEFGRYQLTLPYPNEPFSEAMAVEDSYELSSRLGRARMRVREAEVRSGATVEAPPLSPAPRFSRSSK